jgi:hypothetical protein
MYSTLLLGGRATSVLYNNIVIILCPCLCALQYERLLGSDGGLKLLLTSFLGNHDDMYSAHVHGTNTVADGGLRERDSWCTFSVLLIRLVRQLQLSRVSTKCDRSA